MPSPGRPRHSRLPSSSLSKGISPGKEWAAALADELKAATSRGEPDNGSRYYHHWLAALEHLLTAKGLADPETLLARKEAWAEAYRRTPHGKPVELAVGSGSPESWR